MTDDELPRRMEEAVKQHARDPFREDVWEPLAEGMHYIATDFGDESGRGSPPRPPRRKIDEERGTAGNRVYYFAVPPNAIAPLVQRGRRSAAARRAGPGS